MDAYVYAMVCKPIPSTQAATLAVHLPLRNNLHERWTRLPLGSAMVNDDRSGMGGVKALT